MEEKNKVIIKNADGSSTEVEAITYLNRDDQMGSYLVYSKGEKVGDADDEVIYISRVVFDGDVKQLVEITDDNEWAEVQNLLKRIANA